MEQGSGELDRSFRSGRRRAAVLGSARWTSRRRLARLPSGFSGARLALTGWPLRPQALTIKTAAGRRRIVADTVSCGDVVVHLFRTAPKPEVQERVPRVRLTPRRLQVLRLLGDGMRVPKIAARLGVREATARNHVHALLVDLDAHSQLEAVSKGRDQGLISRKRGDHPGRIDVDPE